MSNTQTKSCFRDANWSPELMEISLGQFLMGSPEAEHRIFDLGDIELEWETPQHEVNISQPFAISRYLVTVSDYKLFCNETSERYPEQPEASGPTNPVVNVLWPTAVKYCRWLSDKIGESYRLPSEAEWEYCARAGTTNAFPWGDEFDSTKANTGIDGYGSTSPVGSFPSNDWGLFDMIGNAEEFCSDFFDFGYTVPHTQGPVDTDHKGVRARRGSCWQVIAPSHFRSAARSHWGDTIGHHGLGFRVVRDI